MSESAAATEATPSGNSQAADLAGLGNQSSAALAERYSNSLLGVFGAPQRVLVRGAGCHVWDADGNQYLDLLGGIAVNTLGHSNPLLTSVITSQLATLGHVSNFFTSPTQIALAEKLLQISAAPAGSKVFFANSGTEANEAALKLTRRNAGTEQAPRTKVIALEHAFHGRTLGALSLTYKEKYRAPFAPLPENVTWIPAGTSRHCARRWTTPFRQCSSSRSRARRVYWSCPPSTCRRPARSPPRPARCWSSTRCRPAWAHRRVLRFRAGDSGRDDSGQGPGRRLPDRRDDRLWRGQHLLADPGDHGTTFGGNPVACAAGLAVIHTIEKDNLLAHVRETGAWLREQLAGVHGVGAVRGAGLLNAFELLNGSAPKMVAAALDDGFIINATDERTIRLAPPLVITREQLATFIAALPGLLAAAAA